MVRPLNKPWLLGGRKTEVCYQAAFVNQQWPDAELRRARRLRRVTHATPRASALNERSRLTWRVPHRRKRSHTTSRRRGAWRTRTGKPRSARSHDLSIRLAELGRPEDARRDSGRGRAAGPTGPTRSDGFQLAHTGSDGFSPNAALALADLGHRKPDVEREVSVPGSVAP